MKQFNNAFRATTALFSYLIPHASLVRETSLFSASLDPCSNKKCSSYSVCFAKPDQTAECVCSFCKNDGTGSPVCGSDGRTYYSECHVQLEICRKKTQLKIIKRQSCGE